MPAFNLVAGAILLVVLGVFGWSLARTFLKFRGDRVIDCPENRQPAGVRIDTAHLVFGNLAGHPDLRLKTCSRWPEKQDCGQECLLQIEASPEDCLVRNILTKWYAGKTCALCGKPIGEIMWADRKPALLNSSHHTVQWRDVPPAQVPQVLASHQPVCWNCHIVNTMVIEHPDLVISRSRPLKS